MEKIKDPVKRKVIEEAEKYIAEHHYVNIGWFIRERLGMNVKGTFVSSVAAFMTRGKLYLKERVYKHEYRIEKNPNAPKHPKLMWWLQYIITPIISAIIGGVIVYLILHYWFCLV